MSSSFPIKVASFHHHCLLTQSGLIKKLFRRSQSSFAASILLTWAFQAQHQQFYSINSAFLPLRSRTSWRDMATEARDRQEFILFLNDASLSLPASPRRCDSGSLKRSRIVDRYHGGYQCLVLLGADAYIIVEQPGDPYALRCQAWVHHMASHGSTNPEDPRLMPLGWLKRLLFWILYVVEERRGHRRSVGARVHFLRCRAVFDLATLRSVMATSQQGWRNRLVGPRGRLTLEGGLLQRNSGMTIRCIQ